jgi:hypothetical protein
MKRLLFILGCALLLLGVTAAPALAAYPVTWQTDTAYVHIWWGSEPIVWTEFDAPTTDPNANMIWHSGEEAIPPEYDVCLAMMVGDAAPRGQVAKWANVMTASFDLDGPDGQMPLQMGVQEVRRHWNAPEAWGTTPYFNKEEGNLWMMSWTFDLGTLVPGTYGGMAAWSAKPSAVSFGLPDPLPDGPLKPSHWNWGPPQPPAHYSFTVDEL